MLLTCNSFFNQKICSKSAESGLLFESLTTVLPQKIMKVFEKEPQNHMKKTPFVIKV